VERELTYDPLHQLVLRVKVVHHLLLTVEVLDVLGGSRLQPEERTKVRRGATRGAK